MSEQRFWKEKRYYSLDAYLQETFGEKIYKVSLDGGMTCPNRDGKLDSRGCIFCSAGGSGDFAAPVCESVTGQIDHAIEGIQKAKKVGDKFIAYFQSYTNTYGDVEYLRQIFTEAIEHPRIVALSIGTRPDCLGEDVLALLEELNRKKPVWVELGLQTMHNRTAEFIRRGYPLTVFEKAVKDLNRIGAKVIVHVILGLPFESRREIMETVAYLAAYSPSQRQLQRANMDVERRSFLLDQEEFPVIHGVKLQLLHVLKGTDLARYLPYFKTLTLAEYVDIVLECLERLPQDIVIHRVTGDGPKKLLLAPLWSSSKKTVMNTIHREMKLRNSWQGKQI